MIVLCMSSRARGCLFARIYINLYLRRHILQYGMPGLVACSKLLCCSCRLAMTESPHSRTCPGLSPLGRESVILVRELETQNLRQKERQTRNTTSYSVSLQCSVQACSNGRGALHYITLIIALPPPPYHIWPHPQTCITVFLIPWSRAPLLLLWRNKLCTIRL